MCGPTDVIVEDSKYGPPTFHMGGEAGLQYIRLVLKSCTPRQLFQRGRCKGVAVPSRLPDNKLEAEVQALSDADLAGHSEKVKVVLPSRREAF